MFLLLTVYLALYRSRGQPTTMKLKKNYLGEVHFSNFARPIQYEIRVRTYGSGSHGYLQNQNFPSLLQLQLDNLEFKIETIRPTIECCRVFRVRLYDSFRVQQRHFFFLAQAIYFSRSTVHINVFNYCVYCTGCLPPPLEYEYEDLPPSLPFPFPPLPS